MVAFCYLRRKEGVQKPDIVASIGGDGMDNIPEPVSKLFCDQNPVLEAVEEDLRQEHRKKRGGALRDSSRG
jgi:hypothetical protein